MRLVAAPLGLLLALVLAVLAVLAVPQVVDMESKLRPTDRVVRTAKSKMRSFMPPPIVRKKRF